MEYEIEAEIFHQFLKQRATGPAYGSIIASGDGPVHCIMLKTAGECLVQRTGADGFWGEYGNYCADLTGGSGKRQIYRRQKRFTMPVCILHLNMRPVF